MSLSEHDQVTLVASGGEEVSVKVGALNRSITLRHLLSNIPLEDDCRKIPLDKISHYTLRKMVVWLEKHVGEDLVSVLKIPKGGRTPKLPDWDYDFLKKKLDQTEFLRILEAANFLQIDELVEMCCRIIANTLRNKSTKEIREYWNVETGWTEEEEKMIEKKYRWCSK